MPRVQLLLFSNNIPDYQTRAMPNTFLGNQGKTSPIPIFHFWIFNYYVILTFEYKFDRMHHIISKAPREYNRFFYPYDLISVLSIVHHLNISINARHEIPKGYMTTKEKRDNSRRPHNMPMEFIVQDHRYLGLIKNISKSGLFIETRELFKVGQVVSMTYVFPPFRGKNKIGKIISIGPQRIGIKFQRLKKK